MLGLTMRMTAASSLWLGFLTTCCLAWPTTYRRSYNYYPSSLTVEDLEAPTNQWDIAQDPLAAYDLPQENYYVDTDDFVPESDGETQWSDIQALTNLMEMYDTAAVAPPATTWGQIVNEKPESELEELKNLQKHHEPEKVGKEEKVAFTKAAPAGVTVAPAATKATLPQKSQSPPLHQPHHPGQKEIPLLRPPNKPKTVEPLPVLTQRSQDVEQKPSPYDTLRKYLSIEDALKKEAEKRRASGAGKNSRQKKRSYVADEESLTGQLTNLKKSVV